MNSSNDVVDISAALENIREQISDAGGNVGRIKIVAVTKSFGAWAVRSAVAAGLSDVGENYAQEARAKHAEVGDIATWHYIGNLQRNKVKMLAPFVSCWQTLDSLSLIDEVAKRCPSAEGFIQVNLTGELGRNGCSWAEVEPLVEHGLSVGLKIRGLMGVGFANDEAETRLSFRNLSKTAEKLGLSEVSMGMSGDLRIAVEEGSTMLRIGSAFFGERAKSHHTM